MSSWSTAEEFREAVEGGSQQWESWVKLGYALLYESRWQEMPFKVWTAWAKWGEQDEKQNWISLNCHLREKKKLSLKG